MLAHYHQKPLSAEAEAFAQLTTENKKVSSTKSLASDISPCRKSLA